MPLPPINLNERVTREQYNVMASLLAPGMNAYGRHVGWCGERHSYFQGILPEYNGYAEALYNPVPDTDPRTDFAESVREVRGRILYWVVQGSVTIGNANEIMSAAGIPPYTGDVQEVGEPCGICGARHGSDKTVTLADPELIVAPTYLG